jgi:hypothetical protein
MSLMQRFNGSLLVRLSIRSLDGNAIVLWTVPIFTGITPTCKGIPYANRQMILNLMHVDSEMPPLGCFENPCNIHTHYMELDIK